jgi:hypothetical protein
MAGVEDLTGRDLEAHRLGQLLLSKPEVRREAQRLAKKVNPALHIPELEMEDRIEAARTESKDRADKLETQLIAERVERRRSERAEQCRAQGLDVEEVEKIVVAEKCSYETAMKIAALQRETAAPTNPDTVSGAGAGAVEMRPDEDWRKAGANGLAALRKKSADTAREMINGFRKGGRAGAR